jgi:PKHD-type hydroxylase
MNHRKLSMTIQLSEPNEYEGGEFEIDPEFGVLDQAVIKQRGTVLVFPSFLRHRVAPVTSGIRRSLVCWAEGPKFR